MSILHSCFLNCISLFKIFTWRFRIRIHLTCLSFCFLCENGLNQVCRITYRNSPMYFHYCSNKDTNSLQNPSIRHSSISTFSLFYYLCSGSTQLLLVYLYTMIPYLRVFAHAVPSAWTACLFYSPHFTLLTPTNLSDLSLRKSILGKAFLAMSYPSYTPDQTLLSLLTFEIFFVFIVLQFQ